MEEMGSLAAPRPSKRARLPSDRDEHLFDTVLVCRPEKGAADQAQEAAEFAASAYLLASYSPYFDRALATEWGGEGKRLQITVPSVKAFGHLLEWVHSLGKALPPDTAAKARLLATAHGYGMEECIAAVAKPLAEGELLASDALLVDCEETVFCAVALWLEASNLSRPKQKAAAACLLPLIRFAHMRPANIANYWHAFRWFSGWDASKEVLVEALVHAAAPQLAAVAAKVQQHQLPAKFVRRASYKKLRRMEFVTEVDVSTLPDGDSQNRMRSGKRYWAGAWWRTLLELGCDYNKGGIGIYLEYILPPGATYPQRGVMGAAAAVGPVLDFSLAVAHYRGTSVSCCWDSVLEAKDETLLPLTDPGRVGANGYSRGWPSFKIRGSIDGAAITRANFRSAGSPIVKDGKMAVKATITLKS
ncbi:hypothetical protein ABPG75_012581 [Micractinium tetrahymenae]